MRYSFLHYLRCPHCHGELTVLTHTESACDMGKAILKPFARTSPAGAGVGPLPAAPVATDVGTLLERFARVPGDPDRDCSVVVDRGLLVCASCSRWFPVLGAIPELLPDRFRDWERDLAILDEIATVLPVELIEHLRGRAVELEPAAEGDHFKQAEIALPSKVSDASGFFGPGRVSPFNPWNPSHSWHLVESLTAARPLLEVNAADVVIDMGSGYSWTTEWLFKSGYEAIGLDICRKYLEIGLERIGNFRPHLVVGDVEQPPFADACADAILAFEAFHHVPDRPKALAAFARLLKPGRPVVLVEPGGAHEHEAVSVDVMDRFGILEKGMDLADVRGYVAGNEFGTVEQFWCVRVPEGEMETTASDLATLRQRSVTANGIFVARKGPATHVRPVADEAIPPAGATRALLRRMWPRVKRRAKAAAIRLGLE